MPIDFRPAAGVPVQRQNGQFGNPALLAIVEMATEPIGAVLRIKARLPGTDEGSARAQKRTAAAGNQIHAVPVQIRTGDLPASSDPDFVGAVRSPATQTPVHKQIVVISVAT